LDATKSNVDQLGPVFDTDGHMDNRRIALRAARSIAAFELDHQSFETIYYDTYGGTLSTIYHIVLLSNGVAFERSDE
jgi:hypothetical protein